MNSKDLPALNSVVNRLMTMLVSAQMRLRDMELSQGTAHDVFKMAKLREEIASIERRLTRAEKLQEACIDDDYRQAAGGRY